MTDPGGLPLVGRHVVVTRPRGVAGALVSRLQALGATVTLCPAIEIADGDLVALRDAVGRLADYDRVIFTSANAVRAVLHQACDAEPAPASWPRVVAIGPETAATLTERGIHCEALPPTANSASLLDAIGTVDGERLLLPRSSLANDELPAALRLRGAQVDVVIAYRTVKSAELTQLPELLLLEQVDVITLASGSAARAVADVLAGAGISGLGAMLTTRPIVACIGEATAAAARDAGLPVDVVAVRHDSGGIVDALAGWFASGAPAHERRP